jgi:F0F1-type ATP synthase assembly protein I
MTSPSKKKLSFNYARYSGLALQMAVIIVTGVFGGYYLDIYLELKYPVFSVVFSLFSVIASIYIATKELLK